MQRRIASRIDIDNAIKELLDLRKDRMDTERLFKSECYIMSAPIVLNDWTAKCSTPKRKRTKPVPVAQESLELMTPPEKFIGMALDLSDFMEE